MPTYTKTLTGTSGDDMLVGSDSNDHISSTGGKDDFKGAAGDDYLFQRGIGAHLEGGSGNDIIDAGRTGTGQYHLYGAAGDDLIRMDLTNKQAWGNVAHVALHEIFHAYGGAGDDTFSFVNLRAAAVDTMARLDDFSPTRDQLVIDGQAIELGSLPAGMRVVSYLGQQWLHINNDTSSGNADPLRGDILIGLDGPRQLATAEETHFPLFPTNVDALPTVAFIDDNYVPHALYAAREASLKSIVSSASSVTGTEGADYIYGVKDNSAPLGLISAISGLGGDDVIDAGSGHDTVNGGAGNDLISGGLDNDTLLGGTGSDRLLGGSEDDRLEGQSGNDALNGGRGVDEAVFSGAKGSYTVTTAGGVTTVVDNRTGSPDGTDTVTGVERLIFADQTVDSGNTGANTPTNPTPTPITGGSAADTLSGGEGSDEIYGRSGDDTLNGLGGNDKLFGEAGKDTLNGGAGNDTLLGAAGADTLDGGTGADDFVFSAVTHSLPGTGQDRILSFAPGEDDIVITAIDANTSLAGDQAFVLDAGSAFTAGEIRQTVSNGNLLLEFNTDADTSAEMTILVVGVTTPLAASDFDL